MDQVTISRELLRQVLGWVDDAVVALSHTSSAIQGGVGAEAEGVGSCSVKVLTELREALEQPAVEPEMHDAKCPALTGGDCECSENPAFIDKPWARFCGAIGRGPDAPYPGMVEAFERHYSQSFADRDWRNEASVWAAAWKAAKAHTAPQAQQPVPVCNPHPKAPHGLQRVRPHCEVSEMKLPEPYLYYADGETFTVDGVADIFSNDDGLEKLYSEAQLRAEIEKRDAVLRLALEALNAHADIGIKADKAIKAIKEVLT